MLFLKIQSKLVFFGYDTTVYFQSASISSTEAIFSEDLDKICSWLKKIDWSLTEKKTNGILFSRISTNMVSSNFDLQIRVNRISFAETFEILGVTIDRELKFDENVTVICKKLN